MPHSLLLLSPYPKEYYLSYTPLLSSLLRLTSVVQYKNAREAINLVYACVSLRVPSVTLGFIDKMLSLECANQLNEELDVFL